MTDRPGELTKGLQAVCLGYDPAERDEAMARVIARFMGQYSSPKGAWRLFKERVETQMRGREGQ